MPLWVWVLLAWLAVAVPAAVVVGRAIRERDRHGPHP
jgi:hypothetical protein